MVVWGSCDAGQTSIYLVTLDLFDKMVANERRKVFDLLYQNRVLNPGVLKSFDCQGGVIENVDLSGFEIVKIYSD